MSERKQETLTTLVYLGRMLRSDKVKFDVNGQELEMINVVLGKLQDFINEINDNVIELREVEIPEADVEAISENLTD